MDNKNINLIVSAATFVLGAVFVLSDSASITANVIGASGGPEALASIIGLVMIVASGALFAASIRRDLDLDRLAKENLHNHEELVKEEMYKQDVHEKAGYHQHHDDKTQ